MGNSAERARIDAAARAAGVSTGAGLRMLGLRDLARPAMTAKLRGGRMRKLRPFSRAGWALW